MFGERSQSQDIHLPSNLQTMNFPTPSPKRFKQKTLNWDNVTTGRRSKSRTAQCPQGLSEGEPGTSTRKNTKQKKPSKRKIVCPKKFVNSHRYHKLLSNYLLTLISCNIYVDILTKASTSLYFYPLNKIYLYLCVSSSTTFLLKKRG